MLSGWRWRWSCWSGATNWDLSVNLLEFVYIKVLMFFVSVFFTFSVLIRHLVCFSYLHQSPFLLAASSFPHTLIQITKQFPVVLRNLYLTTYSSANSYPWIHLTLVQYLLNVLCPLTQHLLHKFACSHTHNISIKLLFYILHAPRCS